MDEGVQAAKLHEPQKGGLDVTKKEKKLVTRYWIRENFGDAYEMVKVEGYETAKKFILPPGVSHNRKLPTYTSRIDKERVYSSPNAAWRAMSVRLDKARAYAQRNLEFAEEGIAAFRRVRP